MKVILYSICDDVIKYLQEYNVFCLKQDKPMNNSIYKHIYVDYTNPTNNFDKTIIIDDLSSLYDLLYDSNYVFCEKKELDRIYDKYIDMDVIIINSSNDDLENYFTNNTNTNNLAIKTLRVITDKDISTKEYDIRTLILSQNNNIYKLLNGTNMLNTWAKYHYVLNTYYDNSVDNKKIIICIDANKINVNNLNMLDIYEYINATYMLEEKWEKIYVVSDVFAVGTETIMKHYMNFYDCYGSYEFKKEIRNNNIFMENNEYNGLTEDYGNLIKCQLLEHMYLFGNKYCTNYFRLPENCGITSVKENIILVTYYGIIDCFVDIKKGLENLGFNVIDFPLMYHLNTSNALTTVKMMVKNIKSFSPKYVLWWCTNIKDTCFKKIKSLTHDLTQHIYYNWDDPHNWKNNVENFSVIFDKVFICSNDTHKYVDNGTKSVYKLYTGYSKYIHYQIPNVRYEYDISFICTNLYEDNNMYPNQYINRKLLIDTIYENQNNFTFSLFGKEDFKTYYEKSYKRYVNYEETNEIFNKSKINLCTHVVGNADGYLNERVFLIMASGGLLLVDPVKNDILVDGYNCIYIDKNNVIKQIESILKNYSIYENIKNNALKTVQKYTWLDWANRLGEKLIS